MKTTTRICRAKEYCFLFRKKVMSCIWRFMYRDVLQPGDTFPMMMRKMVMAISGTVASFP